MDATETVSGMAAAIAAVAMTGGNLAALPRRAAERFARLAAWLGIAGNAALACQMVNVTFVPGVDTFATAVAAPGGLLSIAWMVQVGTRLLRAVA